MAKKTVPQLETERADLMQKIKAVDLAIKAAKDRDAQEKNRAIIDAIDAAGFGGKSVDEIVKAIAAASAKPQQTDAPKPSSFATQSTNN